MWKEDRVRLFQDVPIDRTRGKSHKLKHRWCCLNITKPFCTMKMTEPLVQVAWRGVGICFLGCRVIVLGNQLCGPAWIGWMDHKTSRGSSQSQPFSNIYRFPLNFTEPLGLSCCDDTFHFFSCIDISGQISPQHLHSRALGVRLQNHTNE